MDIECNYNNDDDAAVDNVKKNLSFLEFENGQDGDLKDKNITSG